MKRGKIALTSVVAAAALSAAGFLLIRNDTKSAPSDIIQPPLSDRRARPPNEETDLQPASTASSLQKHPAPIAAQTDAETTYELVEINLRCQIDREAGSGHIRSTSEGLCKDLSLDPLSREEIFRAITYAAEHGSVKAQLDYSGYASRIFEDEKYALDTHLIREFKENTVRFLEAAGSSGQPDAYLQLSDIYNNGAITPKDPVMSYAYAEAYFRTGSSPRAASYLSTASAGLDGAQLRRGKEIANQILNERSSSK
ncbi:hypothetical protein [Stenotrophomonas sp. PD6]|uniref:hypothetical protein n=1 Tax=Stenotrophomonas sp. PD6 TaxID=3368612 RepID=UPI003BA339E2